MKKLLSTATILTFITFTAHAVEPSISDTHPRAHNPSINNGTIPDNTEINKRDRNESTLTPLDQSNSQTDLEITQEIRKSIMKKDLSMAAKNIKIITLNGEVTLRGPVNSRAELETIVDQAKGVPGVKALHNQLEVK